jgi:tRNA nucleotidyltransferase (CCA-adding enzyme)
MTVTLILTHENSDFDAVAAQLAAARLDPLAIPVLSRRLNRNVQHFLTLYGMGLPFVQPDDLKRRHVDQVTVVDTQAFPTVRGMRPDTPVHIIDHHPLAGELAPHQQYTGEPLGATTTLLVEQIRARPITLTPIEASLLALGIYEDTGSLVYGTTTARDVRAVAWLIEQGASLDIVRDFLIHPLSEDQQALFTRLLGNVQAYEFGGFVVLITSATCDQTVEEIATLAHKLRDTYDANAIILLVAMADYVQLVARSTVDNIDVSQIAAQFGGGGHGRAAAAMIRNTSLQRVQARLVEILPGIVRPAVRVEELMSWGVQTITPDDTVEEAFTRMQRFGHEGYPVISNGKIVGLLTRRAVDRATSHGLSQKRVGQVMENGAVSVRLDDSIETLQQVMMQSGWGQVPVVDQDGKILGIVTRTDLIKRWGQRQSPDARNGEIVQRMRAALPAGLMKLLESIAAEAQAQDLGLYVVGGFVRDLLLGTINMDIDLVAEGNAIELAQALEARYGGKIHFHPRFGTAKWLLDEQVAQHLGAHVADWPPFVDFATARREFYEEPAALPVVEQGSIKLDLHRRDFTINTLAIRLSPAPFGKLLDFYGGEHDLRRGIIRVLHSLSFIDDATRLLRAVRFEQRLDFKIEANTEALFVDALPFVQRLTGDRLRHELDLILGEARPERALRRLHDLGVLESINERLKFDEWLDAAFAAARWQFAQPDWAHPQVDLPDVYWIILACRLENPAALTARLQMPHALATYIAQGQRAYLLMPDLSETRLPSEVVERLGGLSEPALVAAWAVAPTQLSRQNISDYAQRWRYVRPTITGHDLKRLGLKPGPSFGKLLGQLRQGWLDGWITTPAEERTYLEQRLAEENRHDGD